MSKGLIVWRLTSESSRWVAYLVPAIFLWPVAEDYGDERVWLWLCLGVGRRK